MERNTTIIGRNYSLPRLKKRAFLREFLKDWVKNLWSLLVIKIVLIERKFKRNYLDFYIEKYKADHGKKNLNL